MKRTLKILGIAAVLVAIAAVTIGAVNPQRDTTEQATGEIEGLIDEYVLGTTDLTVTVTATGTIEPARSVPLGFEIAAIVTEVLVEEGQSVSAGDVLARLDMTNLESSLRNAEIALLRQQLELQNLTEDPNPEDVAAYQAALYAAQADAGAAYDSAASENDIRIAELQVDQAYNQHWQTQLQRDLTLSTGAEFRDSGTQDAGAQEIQLNSSIESAEYGINQAGAQLNATASQGPDTSRLASANAAMVAAQINLDNLLNGPDEIDLALAEANLASVELALEQVRLQLERGELVAPFDGIVAESNLRVGEQPPFDRPALRLIDTSALYVDLPIDETDIGDVMVGQTVELDLDALPETVITGTVTQVDITPTFDGGVVTYIARVRLDPSLEPVRTGMSATAEVVISELDAVLTLPNRFIRRDSSTGQSYVTIIGANGQPEEVAVELGSRNETESEIVSGVQAGQRVILLRREAETGL